MVEPVESRGEAEDAVDIVRDEFGAALSVGDAGAVNIEAPRGGDTGTWLPRTALRFVRRSLRTFDGQGVFTYRVAGRAALGSLGTPA